MPPKWVSFSHKILRHGSHFGQQILKRDSHLQFKILNTFLTKSKLIEKLKNDIKLLEGQAVLKLQIKTILFMFDQ